MAEIIAALIGGVLTLIVAIVTTIVTTKITIHSWIVQERLLVQQQVREISFQISQRKKEIKIQQLQREIEEFYAPLWGIIQRSKALYEVALHILPSENGKVKQDSFTEEDYTIWRFFVEAYLQPLNSQIVDIVNTKSYLSKSSLPSSFHQFIQYEAQGSLYRLWREKSISVQGAPLGYPSSFDKDIEKRIEELKKQYNQLLDEEIVARDAVNAQI